MHDLDEKISALKKYLRKLLIIIDEEATFTFVSTKLIEKIKIDDVLCCIEATFPKEYKEVLNKKDKKLNSKKNYDRLLVAIKNKFWLNSAFYSVYFREAEKEIRAMIEVLEQDIKKIYNDKNLV